MPSNSSVSGTPIQISISEPQGQSTIELLVANYLRSLGVEVVDQRPLPSLTDIELLEAGVAGSQVRISEFQPSRPSQRGSQPERLASQPQAEALPTGFERVASRCAGRVTLVGRRLEPGMFWFMQASGSTPEEIASWYDVEPAEVRDCIALCDARPEIALEYASWRGIDPSPLRHRQIQQRDCPRAEQDHEEAPPPFNP